MYDIAQQHLNRGWSIVPIPQKKKHPVIPWTPYQSRRPTLEELEAWWGPSLVFEGRENEGGVGEGDSGPANRQPPTANPCGIAVICGAVSDNLVCLDFDFQADFFVWHIQHKGLFELPIAGSPRGYHVFFRTQEPIPSGRFGLKLPLEDAKEVLLDKNQSQLVPRLRGEGGCTGPSGDLISDGKLVVLPPTLHPAGALRKWIKEPQDKIPTVSLEEIGIVRWPPHSGGPCPGQAPTPGGVCPGLRGRAPLSGETYQPRPVPTGPFAEGERHAALLSIAARLKRARLAPTTLLAALQEVNLLECLPPLPDSEVRKLADWANRLPDPEPGDQEMIAAGRPRNFDIPPETVPFQAWPERPKAEETPDEEAFLPWTDYVEQSQAGEIEWLVDGFLPKGYLVVFGGTSKAGKSCFLTALAVCVARGEPFMGIETGQSKVLWSCYEESISERAMVLAAFGKPTNDLLITHAMPMIDTEEGIATLRHWIKKEGAKLLIVDPLYGANEAESLKDGKTARNALQPLKELCNETGCTAVVVHHFTKNVAQGLSRERLADSNQIAAVASMDMLMESNDNPDRTRTIRIACRGRGTFANDTWVIRSPNMGEYQVLGHGPGLQADQVQKTSMIATLLCDLRKGALEEGREAPELSSEEIAERLEIHPKTVRNMLAELVRKSIIREGAKRGRMKTYLAVG